jgi:hypothetical protein
MAAEILEGRAATEIMSALLGRKCWRVSCGGSVGTTFQLALGRKLLRHPGVGKRKRSRLSPYEGEFGLLVWCSWQLNSIKGPVTSSEDESPRLVEGLKLLEGRRTLRVSIQDKWYLRVDFSGGMALSVLPTHVGPKASFDGNWEAWTPEIYYAIGTDLICEVEPREYPPQLPKSDVRASAWRVAVPAVRAAKFGSNRTVRIKK